jgi:hypothetical protein
LGQDIEDTEGELMKIEEHLRIDIPEVDDNEYNQQDEFRCHQIRDGIVSFVRRVIADNCATPIEANAVEFDVVYTLFQGLQTDAIHALMKERLLKKLDPSRVRTACDALPWICDMDGKMIQVGDTVSTPKGTGTVSRIGHKGLMVKLRPGDLNDFGPFGSHEVQKMFYERR